MRSRAQTEATSVSSEDQTTATAPNDRLLAAAERALKAISLRVLEREISVAEALAVVSIAKAAGPKDETASPRERAAVARQGHRASIVAEMVRREQEGKGRTAARDLARLNALDRHDPVEVDSLKSKYRRWRREEKRSHVRLPEKQRCK
jgi:hypothetical protein